MNTCYVTIWWRIFRKKVPLLSSYRYRTNTLPSFLSFYPVNGRFKITNLVELGSFVDTVNRLCQTWWGFYKLKILGIRPLRRKLQSHDFNLYTKRRKYRDNGVVFIMNFRSQSIINFFLGVDILQLL